MKIVGFPIDVSRSQDGRIVRGLRTRQALIQATLDLIQAGDVEPTSAAIATIAGVSSRALFQHFTSLSDLYAAAFDLAVSRAAAKRERALKRLGLAEFRDRLLEDIAGSRRPPHHEEIVDRMRWILEDIEGAEAEEDSLGVVEPKDELDRLACEELMALERLMRTEKYREIGEFFPPERIDEVAQAARKALDQR